MPRRCQTYDIRGMNSSSYFHRVGAMPLQHAPLGAALAAAARRWPARPAVVAREEQVTLTYEQLLEQADRLGGALRALGLSAGDRLGLWAPNSAAWVVAMFAAARAGLVSVAINPQYQKNEIEYCLKKVGAKAVLAPETYKGDDYYKILTELVPEMTTCTSGPLKSSKLEELKHVILLTDKDDLP
ncbi:Acyl-CoA synthetase family member 2, mitochondrial [Eumeta japonica]|uniref:Acyl-CoA synthetase family member 2, mitochondrial n=1 Tax=Eumeta variegata TaxID=151549 RepID=A0A4C1VXG8_EUMVA|nr:Acyl-CoA synthetase family member 2, mitochondrial [Eumeta japonica]